MKTNLKIVSGPHLKDQKKCFMDLFRDFNAQDAIENDHSEGTRYKYHNITENFQRFLQAMDMAEISAQDLTIAMVKNFTVWLTENLKSCDRTHIAKHVSRISKAADYAVQIGEIPYNSLSSYKVKRSKSKAVINFEDSEFLTWISYSWHLPIYTKAQDCYTMQMVTGLSYMDLHNYKTVNDLGTGIWIEGIRGKTKKNFAIPLFHKEFTMALEIHNKYSGKIPYIENHFYNRLIREMATMLGIDKYITTHVGRKTFATLKDQNGWSTGPISAMMGNTEKVCVAHYISWSKNKILSELKKRA